MEKNIFDYFMITWAIGTLGLIFGIAIYYIYKWLTK